MRSRSLSVGAPLEPPRAHAHVHARVSQPSESVFTCPVRFDFYTELQAKLRTPAKVVPVFDKVMMQGERGAVAAVEMPQGGSLLRRGVSVS